MIICIYPQETPVSRQHFIWIIRVISLPPLAIDLHLVCKDLSQFRVIHTDINNNVTYSCAPINAACHMASICHIFPAPLALSRLTLSGHVMSGKDHGSSPGHWTLEWFLWHLSWAFTLLQERCRSLTVWSSSGPPWSPTALREHHHTYQMEACSMLLEAAEIGGVWGGLSTAA